MEEGSATEVGVRPFRLGPGDLAERTLFFFLPGIEKNQWVWVRASRWAGVRARVGGLSQKGRLLESSLAR